MKFLLFFILIFALFFAPFCFAYDDDFDTYTASALIGQGDWVAIDTIDTDCVIKTDAYFNAPNSVSCRSDNNGAMIVASVKADSGMFQVRVNRRSGSDTHSILHFLIGSGTVWHDFAWQFYDSYYATFDGYSMGEHVHPDGGVWDTVYIQLASDGTARAQINLTGWTPYQNPSGGSLADGVDSVRFVCGGSLVNNYTCNYDDLYTPLMLGSSLSFNYPTNNSTTTVDYYGFDWEINQSLYPDYDSASVYVCGGDDISCETACENGVVAGHNCFVEHNVIDRCDGSMGSSNGSDVINIGSMLSEGQAVYVKGYLLVGSGALGCTYDLTSISGSDNLVASTASLYNIMTYSDVFSPSADDYCASWPDYVRGICVGFYNFFIPQTSFNSVITRANNQIQGALESKVPFCYFQEFKDVVTNLGTESATSSYIGDFSVPVTVASHGGYVGVDTVNFDFQFLSVADADVVASAIEPYDQALSYVIWLIFISWLFMRPFKLFRPL